MPEKYTPPEARGGQKERAKVGPAKKRETRVVAPTEAVRAPEPAEAEKSPELIALRSAADRLILKAEEHIRKSFEESAGRDMLNYHNRQHTRDVVKNAREILQAIRDGGMDVSDRDMILVEIAAASHDLIQQYRAVETPATLKSQKDGETIERTRAARVRSKLTKEESTNETDSANLMIKWVREMEVEDGVHPFTYLTEAEGEDIKASVEATVPGFDPRRNTVIQPNLTKESSPMTHAIAMADLSSAGRDPVRYLTEGDEVFVEDTLDMRGLDPSALSQDEKDWYRSRIVAATKSKANFALGRKVIFERDIGGLSTAAKKNLRKMFRFETTVRESMKLARKREKMDFDELYKAVGFQKDS
jgi:hypothetical protein